MDETDEELRNIKQVQIALRTALHLVLDESFVNQQQDDNNEAEQQQQQSPFETNCDEQPSIAPTTSKQNETRESPTIHSYSHLHSQTLLHSHESNSQYSTTTSIPHRYDEHPENELEQSSAGSIELINDDDIDIYFSTLRSHSPSRFSFDSETNDNVGQQRTIPLRWSNDDDDQEQESAIRSAMNVPLQFHCHFSTSSISTASTISTPGAFLMRGSTMTRQAQVRTIAPYNNSMSKSIGNITQAETELLRHDQLFLNEMSKNKRKICFIVAMTSFILISLVAAVIVPTLLIRHRAKNSQTTTFTRFQHWSELLSECDGTNESDIDLSMIDPNIIMKFNESKRHFLPNDHQLERCSPQHLALLSLSIHSNMNTTNESNTTSDEYSPPYSVSRYILSVFFFSLQGHEWHNNAEWLSMAHECDWFGVECSQKDNNGQIITGLRLTANNLAGTLPNEIYQLTYLQSLELWSNDITGTISSNGIQKLSSLKYLDIESTLFSGPLPSEIFALPKLSTLGLSQTNPRTVITESNLGLFPKLTTLLIPGDMMGGSIPTAIGLLTSLTKLVIRGPLITGQIPKELAFLSALEFLWIGSASLSGTVPEILFEENKGWRFIHLNANSLTGTIPTLIRTQERLEALELSGNRFSGSIAPEIANCSSMKTLDLSANELKGIIPTEIGLMSALEILNLNFNRLLTGTLPTEIAELENLTSVSVDGCPQLTGTISPLFCHNQIEVRLNLLADGSCESTKSSLTRSCREQPCCKVE